MVELELLKSLQGSLKLKNQITTAVDFDNWTKNIYQCQKSVGETKREKNTKKYQDFAPVFPDV